MYKRRHLLNIEQFANLQNITIRGKEKSHRLQVTMYVLATIEQEECITWQS